MTTAAILCLDKDSRPARLEEFRRCARWAAGRLGVPEGDIFPCSDGADLVEASNGYAEGEVDQLVLLGHGTPHSFLLPGRAGIDTRPKRQTRKGVISPETFAKAWRTKLAPSGLISIAACLCSRSPHWYLRQAYGQLVSPWGPEGYKNGGRHGLTGCLRNAFVAEGLSGWVFRGHGAAGHCLHQALLREHRCVLDQDGWSLFGLVLHDEKPTLAARNKWQDLVKGPLAARWLLRLASDWQVASEIREHWPVKL